jgi:hypothetical protein
MGPRHHTHSSWRQRRSPAGACALAIGQMHFQGLGETKLTPKGSGETEPAPKGSGESEPMPLGSGESKPFSEGSDEVVVIPLIVWAS